MIPKIIPLEPNRVWRTYKGGKILDELSGVQNAADGHFPEDWIASVTPAVNLGRESLTEEGLSKVTVCSQRVTLKHLIDSHPEEFLGEGHYQKYGSNTAFLLKFLDSAIRLHLQCHPTVAFAKKFLNSNNGKTEGYYILNIRDDVKEPYIYLGFQHPPGFIELKNTINEQDIPRLESYFEKIPVKKGDAFYVPGGLPHAIGEGIFMIEIMEPTDLVARIEFEKSGYVLPEKARFMDRGIDFGLSMFDMSAISIADIKRNYFIAPRLIFENGHVKEFAIFDDTITNCFRLNRLEITGGHELSKPGFFIVIIISGAGTIAVGDERFEAATGNKFFIPAATANVKITAPSHIELILAMPPLPN